MVEIQRSIKRRDLIAEIRFRTTAEGGRTGSTHPAIDLACTMEYRGKFVGCLINTTAFGEVKPGDEIIAAMALEDVDYLRSELTVGTKFLLRDYRIIADGEVVEVLYK